MMNNLLNQMKANLFSGAVNVAKKSWLNVLFAQFVQAILMLLLLVPVLIAIFGSTFLSIFENMNNPIALQEYSQTIGMQMANNIGPGIILLFFLAIFIMLIIYAWSIHLFVLITDNKTRDRGNTFMEVFQQSFNKSVFKILGALLLLVLIGIGIEIAIVLFFSALGFILGSPFLITALGIVVVFFVLSFFMRYVITFPAIVLGKMSATEAMSYSLSKITWKQGFKYGLIALLGLIGFYIILIAFTFALGGLMESSIVLGIVVTQVLQIVITSFVIALFYAIIVGLYYRYATIEEDMDVLNVEDHLITDL